MPPELMPALVAALTAFLTGLSNFFLGLLNEDLAYIVFGSLVATQAVKVLLTYLPYWLRRPQLDLNPSTATLIFIVSPLATLPVALATWSFPDRVPAWVVAIAASLLANLAYWIFLQKFLGQKAPALYQKINTPIDRRTREGDPPAGAERREGTT